MKNQLNKIAKDTNLFLKKYIQEQENSKLIYAMKYGLFPGGKKIRSKILIDIGSLFSINYHTLIAIGAAVAGWIACSRKGAAETPRLQTGAPV